MRNFFTTLFGSSAKRKSKSGILAPGDFTKYYFELLKASFPDYFFTIIDERTIKSERGEHVITMSIDNAYIDYQSDPASLQEILARYVSSAGDIFHPQEILSVENIVPTIKPIEFLYDRQSNPEQENASIVFGGVYDDYNGELIIVYAQDSRNSIKYIADDDLKQLSIEPDSVNDIAISNLKRLLASIEREGSNGTYMLVAGGNYEASIILLPGVLTKQNFDVKGELVVAIPNRDLLLVTGSEDREGLETIQRTATESFEQGMYPLSELLYKWNGQKFEKFNHYFSSASL